MKIGMREYNCNKIFVSSIQSVQKHYKTKNPSINTGVSKINLAATYSPTHLRMQYHRRTGA